MTKVLIAIPTAGYTRRPEFYDYVDQIKVLDGTAKVFAHGQSPARNRNIMIQMAIDKDFTHILFLDDDVVVKSDIIDKLIVHDKDIVTAIYLMRSYPHAPIMFDAVAPDGRCFHNFLDDKKSGLMEIVGCGLGAILIKVEVFKRMAELKLDVDQHGVNQKWIRLGELESDHWCDDLGFFQRVRKAGIKLYCDLDCQAGHMASVTVWPQRINDKWHITYDTSGSGSVSLPAIGPTEEQKKMREEKMKELQNV